MTETDLPRHLMEAAVSNTSHPASAANALIVGAGMVLAARFGEGGAIALLRAALDSLEVAFVAQHGQQPGEVAQ